MKKIIKIYLMLIFNLAVAQRENLSENSFPFPDIPSTYKKPAFLDANEFFQTSFYNKQNFENSVVKYYRNETTKFRESIENIKVKSKKSDLIFLIDSSSSVGKANFYSEINFVSRLLKHFDMSFNYTRVALITFSSQGKVIRHIDQISNASDSQDQCSVLTNQIPEIKFYGGGTFTYGALQEANFIFDKGRKNSKKYIFLISDGFSNGKNPVEMAEKLKQNNITIFTIGIQSGNSGELSKISSEPKEYHNFLLNSFKEFQKLIRNALHKDHKLNYKITLKDDSRCNILCERESLPLNSTSEVCCSSDAKCQCGIPSGDYSCVCNPGFIGSGILDDCKPCVPNTYWINPDLCRPCPDINHMTNEYPAKKFEDCICKSGFRSTNDNKRCVGITCPVLKTPENGYFVKHCNANLNAACGARCMSGYQLTGTSLRTCLENGTWSGTAVKCILKNCPSLQVPHFGMITCKNRDLDLSFDYSPRNLTFMETYEDETKRVTQSMPTDTECSYRCSIGYYLVGSKMRNCLPLSKWDGLQTTCKPVLCLPLLKVKYGDYELSDCTEFKVPFGTNCTLECRPGFTRIDGPETKTCTGKKSGIWSHRSKTAKCVDKTQPEIKCPDPIRVNVGPFENSVLIKELPLPQYLNDSSGLNVTYWVNPNIDHMMGTKLNIGLHLFIYTAMDAFNNKAECVLEINVIDKIPPVVENCVDPSEFNIPPVHESDVIEWDEPVFFDNSKEPVVVSKSLQPGYFKEGIYQAIYEGKDPWGNLNLCVLNITVKELSCKKLESPLNGQSYCAKNSTNTWCDVSCNTGYTLYDRKTDSHLEDVRLVCSNINPSWEIDPLPECTRMDLPNSVEQLLTISVDSQEPICSSIHATDEVSKAIKNNLKSFLCENLEDCDIISEVPECDEESNLPNDVNDPNYYRISKRQIYREPQPKIRSNVRIRLVTRVGKKLGVWKRNETIDENFRQVRYQLKDFNTNDTVRKTLNDLNIDLKKIKIDELILCPDGSVLKNNVCVQCPSGTYQHVVTNVCEYCPLGSYSDKPGRVKCSQCPLNYSTKKVGRIDFLECKELCPPGTIAKIKSIRRQIRPGFSNPRSLMPFCRRCNAGLYQPFYDKTECISCPMGYNAVRGSQNFHDCVPKASHPCQHYSQICGINGLCIPEQGDLYSCLCFNGFIGSHCENKINFCVSEPCYNHGICSNNENGTFSCNCLSKFHGNLCEELKYSCENTRCHNNGVCYETDDDVGCDCPYGLEGKYCEYSSRVNYCTLAECENGGRCINTPQGYNCQCAPGYFGKRCNLKPCDFLPCNKNAICIDLMHHPTTKESYMCKCPNGLKGNQCDQIISPCESEPCRNNGKCRIKNLRQLTMSYDNDENGYIYEYECECSPFFYGKNCEIFTTPDYIVNFPRMRSTMNYIAMNGPTRNLNQISCCFWMQSNDTYNYGTIISYATDYEDNIFTFTDHTGFVLYINGFSTVTDIIANDGEWHFICISWTSNNGFYEIYYDGVLEHTGFNLSSNRPLSKNGVFVLGQEQDYRGGGFSETESFIGSIAYLDIWDKFLTGHQVHEYYTSCSPYGGNLYSWSDFKQNIKGSLRVEKSNFCQKCSNNLRLSNGYVKIFNNIAVHYCYPGYRLLGHSNRYCLRSSKWSTINIPYCSIADCNRLPNIENGQIEYSGTVYRSYAIYICDNGFLLTGSSKRICLENGNWSDEQPKCTSKVNCKCIGVMSEKVIIVYSDDKGILKNNTKDYPIGTLAEITCNKNIKFQIDSVLICSEDGEWDGSVPMNCEVSGIQKTITHFTLKSPIVTTNKIMTTTKLTEEPRISLQQSIANEIERTTTTTLKATTTKTTTTKTTTKPKTTSTTVSNTPTTTKSTTTLREPTTTKKIFTTKKTTPSTRVPLIKKTTATTKIPAKQKLTTRQTTTKKPTATTKKTTTSGTTTVTITPFPRTTTVPITAFPKISSISKYQTTKKSLSAYGNLIFFPNKQFWINLKHYLFFGCNTDKKSLLCLHQTNDRKFSDLTTFNLDNNENYKKILLDKLKENFNFITNQDAIKYENFFHLILNKNLFDDKVKNLRLENSLRFLLCQSINNLIVDGSVRDYDSDNNSDIEEKLKTFIWKISIPVFNDFKNRFNDFNEISSTPSLESTSTTIEVSRTRRMSNMDDELFYNFDDDDIVEIKCGLIKHEDIPENGFVIETRYGNKTNPDNFKIGSKLHIDCVEGYKIYGSKEIVCLMNGKWSKILARCSRISCGKPKLPKGAKILKGKLYLFKDELTVQCDNTSILKIACQNNGKWFPNSNC